MPVLSLLCLGAFQLLLDDQPVTELRSAKAQALLAYLAVERSPSRREALMELLWPDVLPQSAQSSLRQTLFKLRQVLPAGLIESDRQTVSLRLDANSWFDVADFSRLLQNEPTVDDLAAAVALYQGDFLQDFSLADANDFNLWAEGQRVLLRQKMVDALQQLAAERLAAGDFEEAERLAQRQIELDPLQEVGYQQAMQSLTAAGQRSLALALFETLTERLQTELAVAPTAETAALAAAIRAGTAVFEAPTPPPAPAITAVPNNLPAQATPFIGRSVELAALFDLIANPDIPLITISGPGGIGKTRLALAVADHYLTDTMFPDGIYFLSLALLRRSDQLIPLLAETVAMPADFAQASSYAFPSVPTNRSEQSRLHHFLGQKRMLLILDNFEHLLDGASTISQLLQATHSLKIIVTSRERLRLQGEQLFPIQGLRLPNLALGDDPATFSAVRLFLQSARRVQPDFVLKAGDMPHLVQLCELVAGMPLGLELAASWVDLLPLATIAAEIRQGLDFLETELRDLPDRHRSIRAVFDYSWQQLDGQQQEIFPQLSVFRGGFTLAAAQTITGASLRTLSTLVGKSLLQYDRGRDRYEIHALLRQYGASRLGEKTAVSERHSSYYCHWLQAHEGDLKGAQDLAILTQIETEIENIRLAWEEAVQHKVVSRLSEAIDSLFLFYSLHGYMLECIAVCEQALVALADMVDEAATRVKIRLNLYQAHSLLSLERAEEAESLLAVAEQQLAWLIERGVTLRFAPILHQLGLARLEAQRGQTGAAQVLMQGCLEQFQVLGDQYWVDNVLLWLGQMAQDLGNYEAAKRWFGESLRLAEARGNQRQMAAALISLGWAARFLGDYDEARQRYEESLTLAESRHDRWGTIQALESLAYLAMFQGRLGTAGDLLQQVVVLSRAVGNQFALLYGLLNMGAVAWLEGRWETAVSHMQQAQAIAQQSGMAGDISHTTAYLAEVRAYLGLYEVAQQQAEAVRLAIYPTDQYTFGRVNRIFGLGALGAGEPAVAYEWFYASVNNYEAIGDREYQSLSLAWLAVAAYQAGRAAEARGHFYEALATAVRIQAAIPLYIILPLLAYMLGQFGEVQRAGVVKTAVFAHPFIQHSPLLQNLLSDLPVAASALTAWDELAHIALAWLAELGWQPS